jgi:hypothetical protein
MKYYICGRKSENVSIPQLSGPWKTKEIANAKKFAAENIDHCLEVSIREVAPKPLRGGSARRNTGR